MTPRVLCSCGRSVTTRAPRGGDGSVRLVSYHRNDAGKVCDDSLAWVDPAALETRYTPGHPVPIDEVRDR